MALTGASFKSGKPRVSLELFQSGLDKGLEKKGNSPALTCATQPQEVSQYLWSEALTQWERMDFPGPRGLGE